MYQELASQKQELEHQHNLIVSSLEEKEVLLKEIHHRVKNNLQLVISLLQLQSSKFDDPQVVAALDESQGRVQSMAMIHQMLYENEDLSEIELDTYILDLSESIRESFGQMANHIQWEQNTCDLAVNIDTAVPLGLIVNELIYNCFKYAFPENMEGKISLNINVLEDGNYRLTVADNGKGLPADFKQRKKKSLGMRLVEALSRQLDGRAEYTAGVKGTEVNVYFRLDWSE